MNTGFPSNSARGILRVITALTLAIGVPAQPAPQHQISAKKMLYPQREYSDWQNYPVRTVQDISPAPKAVPLDRFGGRDDRHFKSTGFFYTQKIDGRWWFIDPDGHPYLNAAVAGVSASNSPASTAAFAKTFGTQAEWMDKTRELLLANGFNGGGAWSNLGVPADANAPAQSSHAFAYVINLEVMNAYGAKHGGTYDVPGHKGYPENTIFAFDPAFETFADQYVAARVAKYHGDPNLIGYFSDNEIPLLRTNLDGFLALPANDPGHQAAEHWMKDNHATAPTDGLRIDFLQYEAEQYFRVVSSAIRKADPNHLYLGCRFYGQQLSDPEVFRAVGKYADAISINVYGIWQLDAETTAMWERESGKPFMVTEFYAKGEDSGMPNTTGAGWLVHTQDDRGLFYENFVLALLESRACVGWQWFKYQDNDPDDPHAELSNKDSNKGIVDRFYKPYGPLLIRMRDLNLKLYGVVDLFDAAASHAAADTHNANVDSSSGPTVEPVSLDLAVRDRHNRSILDLKPEEVTVADNGKQARLTDLRLVNGGQHDEPLITLIFDRPGLADSKRRTEDSLFSTPASAARGTGKRLRQEASRFLNSFPDGRYRFAVVDAWGRLQIQQEYSENRKATEESVITAVQPEVIGTRVGANPLERRLVQVAKTGLDSAGAVVSVEERTLARSMYTAMQTSTRIGKDQHLSLSQACLLALVEAQQSLPGRKAIVYFTSIAQGNDDPYYRLDSDNHAKDGFKSIAGAANQAGVSIYVVLPDALQDTRDNDLMAGMSSADQVGGIAQMTAGPRAPLSQQAAIQQTLNLDLLLGAKSVGKTTLFSQENMTLLAKQTGGDVLIGSGRMTGQVKDLVRSLRTYYEASFVPSSGVEDGSYHTTAFKISRRGLKMRARTGYLAMPPSAGITDPVQPFELPLMIMLKLQQLPAEVDYRARVMQMERVDEGNVDLLAVEVPVSGVQVRTDGSTRLSSAHVSVLATITDSAGTQIERFSEDIMRRWPAGNNGGSAPQFLSFEHSFAVSPGTYVLETAILDDNGGKAAAKRQTFEVSASRSVPELSDLMVVRGIEPADNGNSEMDLLWHGQRQVLPNLYGELPAGAHTVSVFFFAHTDLKSQAPATVKLEVLRNGAPLKGEPLISTLKAGDGFSQVLDAFSVTSAADGKYEVRVTLLQGEKSAEKTVQFVLTGEGERIASVGTAPTGDAPIAVDPPGLAAAEQTTDRPTQEELDRILEDARKNALDYRDRLPNLICQQTTQRLSDPYKKGDWRLEGTFVEVLNYVNHEETRTLIGVKVAGEMSDMRINMSSTGEFGASLAGIFRPESKAKFTWKETGMLRGEPAEVFEYRVEKENSDLSLNIPEAVAMVGYHGRIYIDRATHGVKSLTIITDQQPKRFTVRKAAIRVDYDYVAINDHDYLLPVSAQVVTRVSGDLLKRNDLTFSNFRRFGSNARIVGAETEQPQ